MDIHTNSKALCVQKVRGRKGFNAFFPYPTSTQIGEEKEKGISAKGTESGVVTVLTRVYGRMRKKKEKRKRGG